MEQQGYEAKFIHPLLKRHECPICYCAMRNPVQTECGHLFCRKCLEPVLQRHHPVCPLDREEISQDGIFPDNACRREILNLEVSCNFTAGGCVWVGQLQQLEAHLQECEYREIQCKQCGQYVQSRILDLHQDKQCPIRPEPCPYCSEDIPHQWMEAHLQECEYREIQCKQCGQYVQSRFLDLHQDKQCPMRPQPCPYCGQHLGDHTFTCPAAEIKCHYSAYECTNVMPIAALRPFPVPMQETDPDSSSELVLWKHL